MPWGELFPRQAKEILQRELVNRKGIHRILDQPELLERIEPNVELVKTLLTHKDLLTPKTRVLARKVIDKVVVERKRKLEVRVEQAITGALRKDRHSPRRVFRNLDTRTTLRRNLKNWDAEREKLLVDRVYFYAAEKTCVAPELSAEPLASEARGWLGEPLRLLPRIGQACCA